MKALKFKTNWNHKLDCECFTTIRLKNDYYRIGDIYSVYDKGTYKKKVVIKGIRAIHLGGINDFIAYLDTGYNKEGCINLIKTMYSKRNINWETQVLYFMICVTVK